MAARGACVGMTPALETSAAGACSQRPRQGLRSQVAEPSAFGMPAGPSVRFQILADAAGAAGEAGDVVAHVDDARWPWLEREQGVEAGHAVGLGGRHAQSAADLVERRLADPADPRLDGVERRQQEVAPIARRVAAPGAVAIEAWLARTGDRLDRGPLDGRGQRADDVEIHRRRV